MLDRQPSASSCSSTTLRVLLARLSTRYRPDESESFAGQQLAGGNCFADTCSVVRFIGPAGEAVFLVPGRFAVAQEDDLVHDARDPLVWIVGIVFSGCDEIGKARGECLAFRVDQRQFQPASATDRLDPGFEHRHGGDGLRRRDRIGAAAEHRIAHPA